MKKTYKISIIILILLIIIFVFFFIFTATINKKLTKLYFNRQSIELSDKNNEIIKIYKNSFGNYAIRKNDYSQDIKNLIINKEDKYFYYHLGINPISTARAIINYVTSNTKPTASTITQQLVKILLNQETKRNLSNKLKEIFYSIALELRTNKNQILTMYLNTVFLGNKAEGFKSASLVYFNKDVEMLNKEEQLQL